MKRLFAVFALLICPLIVHAQPYQAGDFLLGQTVRCPWNTHKPSTGSAIVRATAGTPSVYKDAGAAAGYNATEFNTALTDVAGTGTFDTDKTGAQVFYVDTTNAAYAAGVDYAVMAVNTTITDTGTVTLYEWVCTFSIENRADTKDKIRARGTLVSGSTAQIIQLASTAIAASHTWQGLLFCDLATKECAGICDSADGGAGNDTLDISGLATVPGAADPYQILWQTIPLSCITAPPGSGLPLIDATGGVTASHAGSSGPTAPAIPDNAGLSIATIFNNGGNVFSGQIAALYNAALATNTAVGSPANMGSGPSIAANLADQFGTAHSGQCDSSSTQTTCNNASLTEIDDYWNNSSSIVIGTMPSRCVRDFIQSSHRLVFDALPASAANLFFVLRADPSCRLPYP